MSERELTDEQVAERDFAAEGLIPTYWARKSPRPFLWWRWEVRAKMGAFEVYAEGPTRQWAIRKAHEALEREMSLETQWERIERPWA